MSPWHWDVSPFNPDSGYTSHLELSPSDFEADVVSRESSVWSDCPDWADGLGSNPASEPAPLLLQRRELTQSEPTLFENAQPDGRWHFDTTVPVFDGKDVLHGSVGFDHQYELDDLVYAMVPDGKAAPRPFSWVAGFIKGFNFVPVNAFNYYQVQIGCHILARGSLLLHPRLNTRRTHRKALVWNSDAHVRRSPRLMELRKLQFSSTGLSGLWTPFFDTDPMSAFKPVKPARSSADDEVSTIMGQVDESIRKRKEQRSQVAASYLWAAVYWWRDLNVHLYAVADISATSTYSTRFEDNEPVYAVVHPNADYSDHRFAPGTVEGYCPKTDLYAIKVGRHLLHLPAQDLRKRVLDPIYGKGPVAFRPSHMPERFLRSRLASEEELHRLGTSTDERLDQDNRVEQHKAELMAKTSEVPVARPRKVITDGTTVPSQLFANIEALNQLIQAGKSESSSSGQESPVSEQPKLHLTLSAKAPEYQAPPAFSMRTPSPPATRPLPQPEDPFKFKLSYEAFSALRPGSKLHAISQERPFCAQDYRDVEYTGPAKYTLTDLGELKAMPRYFEDTKVYALVSRKDPLANLHVYGTTGCYLPGTIKSPRNMGSSWTCKVDLGHKLGRQPDIIPRHNLIDRAHFQIRPFHATVHEGGRIEISGCACYHDKLGLHAYETEIPKSEAIRSKAKKRIQAQ